jgi:phospholipid N-methyltransferase
LPTFDTYYIVRSVNYHKWILDFFQPYLGRRVVEVGAGKGSFAALILEHQIESPSLLEPSKAMYEVLSRCVGRFGVSARLVTYNSTFRHIADHLKSRSEARLGGLRECPGAHRR